MLEARKNKEEEKGKLIEPQSEWSVVKAEGNGEPTATQSWILLTPSAPPLLVSFAFGSPLPSPKRSDANFVALQSAYNVGQMGIG